MRIVKKILLVLSIMLIVGCSKNDTTKFKREYESYNDTSISLTIDEKADIKYLNVEETLEFLKNKTGIIYFGFPTCPWCRNILPILIDVAIENNQTIYYFNPKTYRTSNNESYNEIMNILNEYLESDDTGNKVLYVPDVYFIKDGNVMSHHIGSLDSQTDPRISLSDNQKEELKNIYTNMIKGE